MAGTEARTVFDVLHVDQPSREDAIAEVTGLEAPIVKRALTGLELEGLALALPGGQFLRSALAAELQ